MNNKFLDTEQINQIINITNYYKKDHTNCYKRNVNSKFYCGYKLERRLENILCRCGTRR